MILASSAKGMERAARPYGRLQSSRITFMRQASLEYLYIRTEQPGFQQLKQRFYSFLISVLWCS